jgi:hypothetical protein
MAFYVLGNCTLLVSNLISLYIASPKTARFCCNKKIQRCKTGIYTVRSGCICCTSDSNLDFHSGISRFEVCDCGNPNYGQNFVNIFEMKMNKEAGPELRGVAAPAPHNKAFKTKFVK